VWPILAKKSIPSKRTTAQSLHVFFFSVYTARMDHINAFRWSWMDIMNKKRYDLLTEAYGTMDDAIEQLSEEVLRGLGLKQETVFRALNRLEECDPEVYQKEVEKRGLRLLTIEDEDYPAALRTLPDAPVFLYVRGDLLILSRPCIAMVGTREMSEYGEQVVSRFVPAFVRAGATTVSGLAQGIDAEVARETLRAGGQTIAVLGHGLGMIYPKENARLADQIVDEGGLILSEYPLDTEPGKYTFPARNRIIAGLSLATVVLEAAEKSGSLITAELALEYGREVAAVPGRITDPHYSGCHSLITSGQAKLVTSPDDVLREIGIVASERAPTKVALFDSPDEQTVYQVLTTLPAATDDIAVKAKLDAATLGAVLTMLELRGVAKKLSGGSWVRN